MSTKPDKLPFEALQDLSNILVAIANKLEREWGSTKWNAYPAAAVTLRATIMIARTTYDSIRFLCADKPADTSRKIEYGLTVLPLARTILDSVFTVIFLFEDLPLQHSWFQKSGWREVREENQRYATRYGGDPNWASYLVEREVFLDKLKQEAGITVAEEADAKKTIQWWPNPGKMIGYQGLSQNRSEYLRFLNDWFYKYLSAASHLSWPGMARRSAPFFAPDEESKESMLIKMRSDAVITTITLLLALASEIQIELNYDLSNRVKFLWAVLFPSWGQAKDLYDLRYQKLLS